MLPLTAAEMMQLKDTAGSRDSRITACRGLCITMNWSTAPRWTSSGAQGGFLPGIRARSPIPATTSCMTWTAIPSSSSAATRAGTRPVQRLPAPRLGHLRSNRGQRQALRLSLPPVDICPRWPPAPLAWHAGRPGQIPARPAPGPRPRGRRTDFHQPGAGAAGF